NEACLGRELFPGAFACRHRRVTKVQGVIDLVVTDARRQPQRLYHLPGMIAVSRDALEIGRDPVGQRCAGKGDWVREGGIREQRGCGCAQLTAGVEVAALKSPSQNQGVFLTLPEVL